MRPNPSGSGCYHNQFSSNLVLACLLDTYPRAIDYDSSRTYPYTCPSISTCRRGTYHQTRRSQSYVCTHVIPYQAPPCLEDGYPSVSRQPRTCFLPSSSKRPGKTEKTGGNELFNRRFPSCHVLHKKSPGTKATMGGQDKGNIPKGHAFIA